MDRGLGSFMGASQTAIALNNCVAAGLLALLLGMAFRHTTDHKALDHFYLLLKTPVGREKELAEAGVDVVYAGNSEGNSWELNHPRAVNLGGFFVALGFSLVIFLILYGLSRIGV
jgi:hypothetical protein